MICRQFSSTILIKGTLQKCIDVLGLQVMRKECYVSNDNLFKKFKALMPVKDRIDTPEVWSTYLTRARAVFLHDMATEAEKVDFSANIMNELIEKGIYYILHVTHLPSEEYKTFGVSQKKSIYWNLEMFEKETWTWSLKTTTKDIKTNIRSNLRYRYASYLKTIKNWQSYDYVLGKGIVDALDYNIPPWCHLDRNAVANHPTPNHTEVLVRSSEASASLKSFGGNFSMIMPLDESCEIGLVHSSHRGPEKASIRDPAKYLWHIGSASRVVVPARCMIFFHANLYHYGARSKLGIGTIPYCLRAFGYMCVKGHIFPQKNSHTQRTTRRTGVKKIAPNALPFVKNSKPTLMLMGLCGNILLLKRHSIHSILVNM